MASHQRIFTTLLKKQTVAAIVTSLTGASTLCIWSTHHNHNHNSSSSSSSSSENNDDDILRRRRINIGIDNDNTANQEQPQQQLQLQQQLQQLQQRIPQSSWQVRAIYQAQTNNHYTACESGHLLNVDPTIRTGRLSTNESTQQQQQQQQEQQSTRRSNTKTDRLRRMQTIRQMAQASNNAQESLESRYEISPPQPIGVGTFGEVFLATCRATGERVAIKRIPKERTESDAFWCEMNALLRIRAAGGHPHICALRESFDRPDEYVLVLELVSGGEMFDHLIRHGAYSEADAARLVREVASALAFLHGIGITHADLKPENIMLSTEHASDAGVKLVDFGCSVSVGEDVWEEDDDGFADDEDKLDSFYDEDDYDTKNVTITQSTGVGLTPAYSPPEAFEKDAVVRPSNDMWSLGVILYIMLAGAHPFDPKGNASDEQVEALVRNKKVIPPIRNSRYTRHLSEGALDVLEGLMQRDPKKRLTAEQMLSHPWVTEETAKTDKIAGSDKRLVNFRKYKSKLTERFFRDAVEWSDHVDDETRRRRTLLEQSFRSLDGKNRGYLIAEDLDGHNEDKGEDDQANTDERGGKSLSMTDFQHLLSENMKNRFFPKGHIIYHENDVGNHMYFINSGTILVTTKDGSRAIRKQGDFFGEGALLHPQKLRSATIKCKTPVHALEISREYFERYLANTDLHITLREKDKIRKKNRAKTVLRLQKNLQPMEFKDGEYLFREAERGDALYIVESGMVDILVAGERVLTTLPGNLCGEHSVITGRTRNCTAICGAKEGCKVHMMKGEDVRKLMNESPDVKTSLRDLWLRRDFKKAVVFRLKKKFPYDNPREAFDAVRGDQGDPDTISKEAVANLMREHDPHYPDEDIIELIKAIDLTDSGTVTYEEFKKVFIADIKTSASI